MVKIGWYTVNNMMLKTLHRLMYTGKTKNERTKK